MKRTLAAVFFAALFATGAFASGSWDDGARRIVGSGIVRSEGRNVAPFTGIELESSGEVTVTQGLVQSVTVETDDNVLPAIRTEVVGGVLHLGTRNGTSLVRVTRLSYRITAPSIEALTLSGSGDIRSEGALRARTFSLRVGGSGNIDASVNADTVHTVIDGSGSITVDGQAGTLSVSIDGSGSLRARDLRAVSADVEVNGSGGADITASSTVGISINGSGGVTYGGGARATVRSSGSGTARQR